jgi:hypothetical protein
VGEFWVVGCAELGLQFVGSWNLGGLVEVERRL